MLMQPGDTITPGGQPPVDQPNPVQPAVPTPESTTQTLPTPQQEPIVQAQPVYQQEPQPVFEQTFQPSSGEGAAVSWTASEYIDHAKGPAWFAMVGVGIILLSVVVYFLLKDFVAPILLALAGTTVAVFAGRKPQVIQYAIDDSGIHIGQRTYSYGDFKSFSLTEAGPLPAILLTPLKRFLPPITIFYDPNEEDKIVDALADYLPHEDKEPDMVDRFMGRIRF
jgi:hypothetical protein